ncbi:hypothetical protein BDZ94DRAFT_293486 [Collybia nuda]|uniref:Uncharacterized protein n=1 Tax=Collybia nuda TaxID=64659 RepID=A0A9P5XWG1_9AGAR|nr:hypothetical protein BDZ94DRAFT_293486 [Collybia nuda]
MLSNLRTISFPHIFFPPIPFPPILLLHLTFPLLFSASFIATNSAYPSQKHYSSCFFYHLYIYHTM